MRTTKNVCQLFSLYKFTAGNKRSLKIASYSQRRRSPAPSSSRSLSSSLNQKRSCFIFMSAIILSIPTLIQSNQYTTRDPRFYSREGVDYHWPNPGDPDYRTYTYNDRRYGHYQPSGYGQKYPGQNYPSQYPAHVPQGDDRFNFDPRNPNNPQTPFPGILGGWREDLQGKQRRDSPFLDRDIFITTNYGEVQGFKVYLYDNPDPRSFYRPWHSTVDRIMGVCSTFLGIPYALPPTFEGRFKPPRLHRGWQLVQAVDFGPACPQPVRYTGATKGVRDMDEDCLYLNIYTPDISSGVSQKYPVMVYIHGGDFVRGASNLFPGHILATFYNVTVVTFNYRLGALGFLSTGDDNSPGNYGILDQAMALRWVYENIEFFAGDRNLITLFGPGAGAASAGLLMVAPQTRNYVTRVIAQSGSALADWALINDKYRAQNTSRVFGKMLGCSMDNSWKLVNCLRQGRNFYELGNSEFTPQVGFYPWSPVLEQNFTYPGDDWYDGWREKDWKFLTDLPENLIRQGKFNRGLHYMTGITTQEAAYLIAQNETLAPYYQIDEEFFDQKIREFVLRYNYTLNPNGIYEAIKYMYTFWPDPNNKTLIREQYINFLSDFLYKAPVDKIVKLLLEKRVPVFMYVLNTTVEALKLPDWRKYPHEIEHYFLTGAPFMDVEFFPKKGRLERNAWTDNDRNMSHFFMKTFSDFARYGNPTPQQVLGLHYERAYQGELRYLNINTTFNSSIMMNHRQTEFAFWTQYLPTLVGVLVPTYPPTTEFWWEPKEPLQIAFWGVSGACMFLVVILVICCILWRNAKRQADRYYDEDVFIPDSDRDEHHPGTGIDNSHMVTNHHAIKSKENIYEYRDSPSSKAVTKTPSETASLRSPSTLTVTQTIKSGSQNSLRSMTSLKESTPIPKEITLERPPRTLKETDLNGVKQKHQQQQQQQLQQSPEERNLLAREFRTNSTEPPSSSASGVSASATIASTGGVPIKTIITTTSSGSRSTTPVPSSRRNLKSSRTQLIEGIPQTSV